MKIRKDNLPTEIQEISKEQIEETLIQYKKKQEIKEKKKRRRIILAVVSIFIVFFYLRFFNTVFYKSWSTGRISVRYSTAWFIRYPSSINKTPKEGEVEQITSVINYDFSKSCPYAKFVYIEDGIKEIGASNVDYPARYGFAKSNLWTVRLPDTISYVAEDAFYGCTSLRKLFWKKAAEDAYIGKSAFESTRMKEIEIPEGVSTIGVFAFSNNIYLKSVKIPNSVTYMDTGAFSDNGNLTEVKLSEGLDMIPNCAFSGCRKLQEIEFPESIAAIGRNAFLATKITKEQFPKDLYFYSYITTSEDGDNDYIYYSVYDGLDFSIDNCVDVYDMELESKHLSEKNGIPLEVFSESKDSNRVWIEGQFYTFPMPLEEFLAKDEWSILEPEMNKYEHVLTGRRIGLKVTEEANPVVYGVGLNPKSYSPCCRLVFPGGITNQGMYNYRIDKLFGFNEAEYFDAGSRQRNYTAGSEQQSSHVRITFESYLTNKIEGMEISFP